MFFLGVYTLLIIKYEIMEYMKKYSLVIILSAVVIVVALFVLVIKNNNTNQTVDSKKVTFMCDSKKTIDVIFYPGVDKEVKLSFNGNTDTLILKHVVSGSGARYANKDESFVFWNKGNTAFITEKDVVTFANCVTKSD
jgi:membrane-bound inhibitor of C-type lysozyme